MQFNLPADEQATKLQRSPKIRPPVAEAGAEVRAEEEAKPKAEAKEEGEEEAKERDLPHLQQTAAILNPNQIRMIPPGITPGSLQPPLLLWPEI